MRLRGADSLAGPQPWSGRQLPWGQRAPPSSGPLPVAFPTKARPPTRLPCRRPVGAADVAPREAEPLPRCRRRPCPRPTVRGGGAGRGAGSRARGPGWGAGGPALRAGVGWARAAGRGSECRGAGRPSVASLRDLLLRGSSCWFSAFTPVGFPFLSLVSVVRVWAASWRLGLSAMLSLARDVKDLRRRLQLSVLLGYCTWSFPRLEVFLCTEITRTYR